MKINYIITGAYNNIYLLLILYTHIMFYALQLSDCRICKKYIKIGFTKIQSKVLNKPSFINKHTNHNILRFMTMPDTKKPRLSRSSTDIIDQLSSHSTASTPRSHKITFSNISEIKINFTKDETQLIEFLRECLSHYKLKTVLRIAGGWVRDKIMGLDSSDIDIALSDKTGVEFANLLSEFNVKYYGKSIGFGVIEKRPEHSKHLETVALQIGGLQVDFVNLRHDSYTCEDNRIPEIRIGTEKEDAFRRDFTINALFYNINTDQVEDLTNMGLDDIRNGVIRTPLDPLITFLDDPLRVVRAIRFATRFNFKLTDELNNAAAKSEVTNAFIKKVTRSRLSNEIYNILIKSDQPQSFILLNKFNLLPWLAEFPKDVKYTSDISTLIKDNSWIEKGIQYMSMAKQIFSTSKIPFLTISEDIVDSFYIALFVHQIYPIQYLTNKLKPVDLIDYVIKESLKLRKRHYIQSKELNSNSLLFNEFIDNISSLDTVRRDELGYMVRSCGKYWREAFFINFLTFIDKNNYKFDLNKLENYADKHIKLYNKIIDMHLDNAHELQPKLNGDDIKKILPKISHGSVFKNVTTSHIKYLLQNPNCTIDEASEHLKTEFKDLA